VLVGEGYLGSLFKPSDIYIIYYVTARGPFYRYLLRAIKPLRLFLIEYYIYYFY